MDEIYFTAQTYQQFFGLYDKISILYFVRHPALQRILPASYRAVIRTAVR